MIQSNFDFSCLRITVSCYMGRTLFFMPSIYDNADGDSALNQGRVKAMIRKTTTKLCEIVGGLSIPAAALDVLLVTPSGRILAHGVGAAFSEL